LKKFLLLCVAIKGKAAFVLRKDSKRRRTRAEIEKQHADELAEKNQVEEIKKQNELIIQ
jgi:hypothetical protein